MPRRGTRMIALALALLLPLGAGGCTPQKEEAPAFCIA